MVNSQIEEYRSDVLWLLEENQNLKDQVLNDAYQKRDWICNLKVSDDKTFDPLNKGTFGLAKVMKCLGAYNLLKDVS